MAECKYELGILNELPVVFIFIYKLFEGWLILALTWMENN